MSAQRRLSFGIFGRKNSVHRTTVLVLALALFARPAAAQKVPPNLEAAIQLRVLSHDRALKSRVGDKLVIAVLINPGSSITVRRGKLMDLAFRRLAEKAKVQNMKASVRLVRVDKVGWEKKLQLAGVDALYIPPGFKKKEVAAFANLSERLKLATLTSQRSYLSTGVIVAVTERKGRIVLVVNEAAAKRAGVNLSKTLMRRAERWRE